MPDFGVKFEIQSEGKQSGLRPCSSIKGNPDRQSKNVVRRDRDTGITSDRRRCRAAARIGVPVDRVSQPSRSAGERNQRVEFVPRD
jgi:hypothetical protein